MCIASLNHPTSSWLRSRRGDVSNHEALWPSLRRAKAALLIVSAGSHHLALPQFRNLVLAKTKFGEHLVGLFAEFRRPRRHFARRSRQRHRLADQADVTVLGIRHILRDAEMLDLSVLEHLIDGIDRPTGHAGGIEFADPGVGGFFSVSFADLGVERIPVLGGAPARVA